MPRAGSPDGSGCWPVSVPATPVAASRHHGSGWHVLTPLARIRVQPLTLGGVHAVISKHLGHTLPRPLITRIHEVSGGNPFFALELARSVADEPSRGVVDLPDSLAALVRQRIGRPNKELSAVLLAASCAALPTIERVSRAIDLTVDRVVEVVESVKLPALSN